MEKEEEKRSNLSLVFLNWKMRRLEIRIQKQKEFIAKCEAYKQKAKNFIKQDEKELKRLTKDLIV